MSGAKRYQRRQYAHRPVPIPERCPKLVRQVFEVANARRLSCGLLEDMSGVGHQSIRNWTKHQPLLLNFEAVANAVGFDLVLVPRGQGDNG